MPPSPADYSRPSSPSCEVIREQLRQILESPQFATAIRSRRFLTHIVEETLAGRTDAIKELVLGIEVFDRPGDFDPKADNIVRVDAIKLRKRLQEYYEKQGAAAALRIEVPKGSYVPQFHGNAARPAPTAYTHKRLAVYAGGLLMLLSVTGFWWAEFRLRKPPAEPSVAVLPFQNFSPDPANEYLADGLVEELTGALCQAGGMRVASRTSAFFFKGKQADVHEIGARLHVAFVIEGSVRRQADRLRVAAQIIRTDDGYHIWSGSFDREMRDVFALEQDAAASVVSALQVKLTDAQHRRLRKTHTASLQAFDLYLRGRHATKSIVPGDIGAPERLFQQSITADPAYALPYVALADLYIHANILATRPARDLAGKAKEKLNQALALDNELAEAHALLGSLTARHEYNWAAAERRGCPILCW